MYIYIYIYIYTYISEVYACTYICVLLEYTYLIARAQRITNVSSWLKDGVLMLAHG